MVLNYSSHNKGKVSVWDRDLNYPLQTYDTDNVDEAIIKYKKDFNIK